MKFVPQIDDYRIAIKGDGVETEIEKGIVVYDIPYADGAVCDDMGVMARRYKFTTLWINDNYDKYEEFFEHVSKRGVNHFVHPELGIIAGRIENITCIHDRRKKCAEIAIEFIEDKGAQATPTFAPSLTSAMEAALVEVANATTESTRRNLLLRGFDVVSGWIEKGKDVLKFVTNVTAAVTNVARQIQRGLDAMNSVISTVTNAVSSVASLVTFVATLPGTIVGSITRAIDSIAQSWKAIKNSPKLFMSNLKNALKSNAKKAEGMENVATIMSAAVAAVVVAEILEEDAQTRTAAANIEDSAAGVVGLNNAPAVEAQPFTHDDLDIINDEMTEIFNDAINAARDEESPETVAALSRSLRILQAFINDQKNGRERIITVNIETPMPLHAILLRYDIPQIKADSIILINDIKNPNFVSGPIRLYMRGEK